MTLSFFTMDGTATAGSGDFVAKTGMLTFAPGETMKTIILEDQELSFSGPVSPEVPDAWRARFNRMKLLRDFCGEHRPSPGGFSRLPNAC